MRVIEKGAMRVICKKCEEHLEIVARDLTKEAYMHPSDPTRFSYVCPCCRQTNYLLYSDLSNEMVYDMINNN